MSPPPAVIVIEPSMFVTTMGVMGLLMLANVSPHLIGWACANSAPETKIIPVMAGARSLDRILVFIVQSVA